MTYERAVARAKVRTAAGVRSIPCVDARLGWRTKRVNVISWLRGRHGHHLRGEQVATAKLTEILVRIIRAKYASGDFSMDALAYQYGVSDVTIRRVVTRERWKHVA
jgi:hypothetical protein